MSKTVMMLYEKSKSIPWKKRPYATFMIKRLYIDKGIPVEQFLEDHKDLVESYNITINDLMYIVERIKEYELL